MTAEDMVNVVATLGQKGPNYQECDGNYDEGSNILSVAYHPGKLLIYAAFDNGMGEEWVPAACNQYVAVDLHHFLKDDEIY